MRAAPLSGCRDPVAAERDRADGAADRQGPAGLEQPPGLAGAQRLRERRPELRPACVRRPPARRPRCTAASLRAGPFSRGGHGDEREPGGREVGGADEDEGQLAVGLVPRRGGRVGEQHRGVGGERGREERRPHRGRSVRELQRLGDQAEDAGSAGARAPLEQRAADLRGEGRAGEAAERRSGSTSPTDIGEVSLTVRIMLRARLGLPRSLASAAPPRAAPATAPMRPARCSAG